MNDVAQCILFDLTKQNLDLEINFSIFSLEIERIIFYFLRPKGVLLVNLKYFLSTHFPWKD
jgi:hypothetical protein